MHDHLGYFMIASCRFFSKYANAFEAELLAAREGLELARHYTAGPNCSSDRLRKDSESFN